MYCRHCGVELNENQDICVKCGVLVGKGKSYCANCGNALPENADFCMNCGVAVKKEKEQTSGNCLEGTIGGQDKLTIALICFFFGFIGIHNFMMGEKNKGIMKIVFTFVCGISWIFALIDFINILTNKYVVDETKYF